MVGKARSSASWQPPRPTVTTKKGGRQVQLSVSLKSRGAPQHLADGQPVPSQLWFATKAGTDDQSQRTRGVHLELLHYLLGHTRWEELSQAAQHLARKHFADFPAPAPEVLRSGDYLVRVRDRWIGERVARSELPAELSSAAPSNISARSADAFMPAVPSLPSFQSTLLASAMLGPAGLFLAPSVIQQLPPATMPPPLAHFPPATMPPALSHLSAASIMPQQVVVALQATGQQPAGQQQQLQQPSEQQQPAEHHHHQQQQQQQPAEQQQQQPSEQQQRQLQLLSGLGNVVAPEAGTGEQASSAVQRQRQQQQQQQLHQQQQQQQLSTIAFPTTLAGAGQDQEAPMAVWQAAWQLPVQPLPVHSVPFGPQLTTVGREPTDWQQRQQQQSRQRQRQRQQQQLEVEEEKEAGEPQRRRRQHRQVQPAVQQLSEHSTQESQEDSEVAQILRDLKAGGEMGGPPPAGREQGGAPRAGNPQQAGDQPGNAEQHPGMPELHRGPSPDGLPGPGAGPHSSSPAAAAGKQGPGPRSLVPSLRLTAVGSNSAAFAEAAAAAVKEHDEELARAEQADAPSTIPGIAPSHSTLEPGTGMGR